MAEEVDPFAAHRRAGERVLDMARSDPQLGALMPDKALAESLQNSALSLQQMVAIVMRGYAGRQALGTRAHEVVTDEETGDRVRRLLPAYREITYGELGRQIEAVASFWRHTPGHRVDPGDMIATLGFTSAELAAADLAGIYADAILVPLQPHMPVAHLDEILQETAPTAMVATPETLELALDRVLKHESFRSLLLVEADTAVDAERRMIEDARARLTAAGGRVALATFGEALTEGGSRAFEPLPPPAEGRDSLRMIMYTSGSTGAPKGAMVHDAILANTWATMRAGLPGITFMFAPLNHFMGRNALYATLTQGNTAYFTLKSDLSTLLEDIRLARPTTLGLIPRICEMAHQHYLAEAQKLVTQGIDPATAGETVRAAMRPTFFGDRLTSCTVGSAPTSPELRQFLAECFDIAVSDGYGSTEVGGGGITFNNRIVATSVVDHKLIDVPELGYYTSDKPYPRGEMLVKTRHMIKGYYKRPEASAAIFDAQGFLRTGDIMEQRGPDHFVWLDRRNNVMKLSQGEYVAIGPLETLYLGHGKLIDQLFLYGSGQRAFLLAVVVPDIAYAQALLGHAPTDEELRRLVLEQMREAAREAGLRRFEVPRDALIEHEPFSIENGLLSGVRKPLRPNLARHYRGRLDARYEAIERKQSEELSALRTGAEGLSTAQRVAEALKLGIGLAELDPADPQSYTELGGDSLGAVNIAMLLEEMFGVPVPVSKILHPAASAARIAAEIDALLSSAVSPASFEAIHPDPDRASATDLTLDRLYDEDMLRAAAVAAPPATTVRTALLTGANGYLGRFLCLSWLEYFAGHGGKLIALVRGRDAASARQRIDEAIGSADPALTARFAELAKDHLEVIAADLAAPRLGLDEETYARLADEVDQIVHPAALVNHRLAYRNLFEPNVMGTAELVRLALTDRLKRFDYVSSVAVVHSTPALAEAGEDADIREAAPAVPISGERYALGYAASKWAGEIILREAHARFGLPASVYRCDMILPHSCYRGQFNAADTFTRLVASIVMTGVAPKSFYRLGPDGERRSAHYDGLPVDFIAAAIQRIGARNGTGYHSYNVLNPHAGDGVSLDSIVDWIIDAGHDVTRIDDHGEWLRRFEEKLRNLPDAMRRRSSLSVLGALRHPMSPDHPQPGSARFREAVGVIPHLDRAYIGKFLEDLPLKDLARQPQLLAS